MGNLSGQFMKTCPKTTQEAVEVKAAFTDFNAPHPIPKRVVLHRGIESFSYR
jgi:hypothetical protein